MFVCRTQTRPRASTGTTQRVGHHGPQTRTVLFPRRTPQPQRSATLRTHEDPDQSCQSCPFPLFRLRTGAVSEGGEEDCDSSVFLSRTGAVRMSGTASTGRTFTGSAPEHARFAGTHLSLRPRAGPPERPGSSITCQGSASNSTGSPSRTAVKAFASPRTRPTRFTALAGRISPCSLMGVGPKKIQKARPVGQ